MNIANIDKSKLAKTGEEYLKILESNEDWIVRTPDDLKELRKSGYSPLAKLSDEDFKAFVQGIAFNKGGVADGSYKPLMGSLTITEIMELFERFGMSSDYTLRILEAKCEGGWQFEFWSFCSSACEHATEPMV